MFKGMKTFRTPGVRFVGILLALSVLIETLCLTYVQEKGSVFYYSNSVVYVIAGLLICILPLIPVSPSAPLKTLTWSKYAGAILLAIFAIYHIWMLVPLYTNVPIDKQIADMLPSIKLACQRFSRMETVYKPAPEIWSNAIIPYLPMMWMPFLPAEWLHFDYRWITLALQTAGISLAFTPLFLSSRRPPLLPVLIGALSLFLLSNFLLIKHNDYWSMTEEGLVAGFYMLLCWALLRRNYRLTGIAIMCCTLSRYSLLMWIPVFFGYVWLSQSRDDFKKMAFSYLVSVLLLFILPFFIWDPAYFFHISDGYMYLGSRFWEQFRIEEHLYQCVGLFKFYTLQYATVMFRVGVLLSLLLPLLFLMASRRLSINQKYVAVASLKLCITCFFSFITMPYFYIFVPPTLVSYVILFDYLATAGAGRSERTKAV